MSKLINTIMAVSLFASCTSNKETQPEFRLRAVDQPFSNEIIEKKVNDLYDQLSDEERLAQIHGMYLHDICTDGKFDPAKAAKAIPNGIGHFSQYASNVMISPDELRDLVADAQKWIMTNTKNPIPALLHEEVLSGAATMDATTYPQQIGQACSFNPELAAVKTKLTAKDMRAIGGFLALSPMVDVDRNPYFNRNEESYGEDSYLSAAMGVGFVKGLQDGGLEQGMAACTKHFLGYGGGGDSDYKELMEEILLPHEAMIRVSGSKVVMTGYHEVHGMKCVANNELQNEILRQYLNFDGIMVSDYGSVSQLVHVDTPIEKAAATINAGNDVEFPDNANYQFIPEAIEKGMVSKETFEKAVKRVLTLKARLGLLEENPKLYEEGHLDLDKPECRQVAYDIATQSVVLLQNNGVLPLKSNGNKKIFLTGPNANNMWAMLGDYTYNGMAYFWRKFEPDDMHPRIVNLRAGLESRLPEGYSLQYERGCDWTEVVETVVSHDGDARWLDALLDRKMDGKEPIDRAKAIKLAAESDVIIAAMGENTLLCGENRDRGSLRLPGSQEAYVEELIATGKPVVLVMFGGRAQVISNIKDKCAAIIQAWYPGEEGGNAVADILMGNVAPSGKLSVSYPNVELNENICYNYSTEKDSRIDWPFGFGLSYTDFSYDNLDVTKSAKTSDHHINIEFDLTNSGSVAGTEIVQIYLSPTSETQPVKPIQLQGFGRVDLAAGETKHVSFIMSPQQFGYFADGHWNIAPGEYKIKIAASSQDIRLSADIELTGEKIEMPLRDVYFSEMQ